MTRSKNSPDPILICAADAKVRESVRGVLGDTRTLILCEDPESCLEIAANARISVVLLDVSSPAAGVIQSLKSSHPSLKIITMSKARHEESARQSVQQGADGYLIYPLKPEALLSVCRV